MHSLVDSYGLVDGPEVSVADAHINHRIDLEVSHVLSLLVHVQHSLVVFEGELVFSSDPVEVGEVVVGDGVLGVGQEGVLVAASSLSVFSCDFVAGAHVAVGLEVPLVENYRPHVILYGPLVVVVQLVGLGPFEVLLSVGAVLLGAGPVWP